MVHLRGEERRAAGARHRQASLQVGAIRRRLPPRQLSGPALLRFQRGLGRFGIAFIALTGEGHTDLLI